MSHTADHAQTEKAQRPADRPFFELRVGGLHLTVQRPPYRLTALAATALTTGAATWITQR
ncbi:hypothetical protein VR46_37990 [Streptomyces sp. NRRL S-444]|nr:hypothetical protein VR46_37990 [Streptomyces sp. NRRL S-444]